jgi:mRNA-degrading endonuclease RelE of RelBE toxin-antitoxin system
MASEKFKTVFTKEAEQDLLKLDSRTVTLILDRIGWLEINIDMVVHRRLKGKRWGKTFKLRASDYRIIYLLDRNHHQVIVLKIGHRKDVYL